MTDEQKSAFINSQVACALIELAAMQAENSKRERGGYTAAYTEDAFLALQTKYLIGHNEVLTFLRQ